MPCGGSCSPAWAPAPATRAYLERRAKEGKSKAEIICCLKRYVARQVYPHLRPDAG
jgi:transposase